MPAKKPSAPPPRITPTAPLTEALYPEVFKRKYLTYALSVVKGRAIPDGRDGLKPVQRRVLWAMHQDLKLGPGARYRKSAAIVGMVLGKYHPHGEDGAYQAMVRMAQDFSLRYPLVDGQGNFGSLDGDGAAAPRYTEARLALASRLLLGEAPEDITSVPWVPNYDGTAQQPAVLPASAPHLLLNGASGIAVGMATEIPPHRLPEVAEAAAVVVRALASGQDPAAKEEEVLAAIPGPDFPTGGTLVYDPEAVRAMYRSGRGSVQVRARWRQEGPPAAPLIVFDQIPPAMDKATLVTKVVAAFDEDRALAAWVDDWRDESAEDVRLVLQLRRGAPVEAVLGTLWLRTPLQQSIPVNMTALLPKEGAEDGEAVPGCWGLVPLLSGWARWRRGVVERRLTARSARLRKELNLNLAVQKARAHRAEVTELISNSADRAEARAGLMSLLSIDEEAAEHLLNMRMGALARAEAEALQARGRALTQELASSEAELGDVWGVILKELDAHANSADPRKTALLPLAEDPWRQALEAGASAATARVEAPAEDCCILLSKQGWVRRQRSAPADPSKVKTRDGDALGWVLDASTRHALLLVTNLGRYHLLKAVEITAAPSGHGEPLSVAQGWQDGEAPVLAMVLSPDQIRAGVTLNVVGSLGGVARVRLEPEVLGSSTKSGGKVLARLSAATERVLFADLEDGPEPPRYLLRTTGQKVYGAAPAFRFPTPGAAGVKVKPGPRLLVREGLAAWGRSSVEAEDGRLLTEEDFPRLEWNGWAQML